ncbi:MAG: hypothetical protein LUF92_08950 [Clostridiales bacterium]|nr:hypothetical protein [Clostridiales bacterium]
MGDNKNNKYEEFDGNIKNNRNNKNKILDGKRLDVHIHDCQENGSATSCRTYPVFQQKAGDYNEYSEYMTRHGCACCSLTTLLAAYVPSYRFLRPDDTIRQVEKKVFSESVWQNNYGKPMARQMPVSLYGISCVLKDSHVAHRYMGAFEDAAAMEEIEAHLFSGKPVVIETSRMKREHGRVVRWFDKKYAGSYHTMILLGIDRDDQIIFTDSATRDWAGERQRIKWAALSDLMAYMFPQKNVADRHVYFSKRKNTGGYILVDAS